jgi:hypothetical protein
MLIVGSVQSHNSMSRASLIGEPTIRSKNSATAAPDFPCYCLRCRASRLRRATPSATSTTTSQHRTRLAHSSPAACPHGPRCWQAACQARRPWPARPPHPAALQDPAGHLPAGKHRAQLHTGAGQRHRRSHAARLLDARHQGCVAGPGSRLQHAATARDPKPYAKPLTVSKSSCSAQHCQLYSYFWPTRPPQQHGQLP